MYLVQAEHKTGYKAPYMYVNAGNGKDAAKATRLSDFPEQWRIRVIEVKNAK